MGPITIYDVFQVNGLEVDKYDATGQQKVLVVLKRSKTQMQKAWWN